MSGSATASAQPRRADDVATPRTAPMRSQAGEGTSTRTIPGPPRESADVGPAASDGRSARVLIADHRATSRRRIRLALERAGLDVVAAAGTAEDAVASAATTRPDACVVDMDIPGGGIAVVRAIHARVPGTAILTLNAGASEDDFVAALMAGASGYLLKAQSAERIPAAVRGVLAGEVAMIPRAFGDGLVEEIRRRVDRAASPDARRPQASCPPRESKVVRLMREELPTRDIAARLGISEATVRRHVSAALRELEAPDRPSAIRLLARAAR
jgi:DNA-binding NarL/FixJ family response regulator